MLNTILRLILVILPVCNLHSIHGLSLVVPENEDEPFVCPVERGYFPHPKNCHQYYLCFQSKPYLETCPSDLLYLESEAMCELPNFVDCGDKINPTKTSSTQQPGKTSSKTPYSTKTPFICPSYYGLFSHPREKKYFYQCAHGFPHLKLCPSGLEFDPNLKVCNWPV
ncbi:probable endochitinase [Limulus polyphemus]|uniref:Probable endochitinase n=1 Tax=Limulus polyphemus TaxID=6850 RepID=A0ABM1TPR2_LIMPO|nr:probable endochitinase [Limulus polyphemus]